MLQRKGEKINEKQVSEKASKLAISIPICQCLVLLVTCAYWMFDIVNHARKPGCV